MWKPSSSPSRSTLARRPCSSLGTGAAEKRVEQWEQDLQSLGDDAQLANIDLQNQLQKQQQVLQTISKVSKMLDDTAMGTVRKIG
jgi:hypothetical protein